MLVPSPAVGHLEGDKPLTLPRRETTMRLDPDDCRLFYRLHKALMLFVNRRLQLVQPPAAPAGEIIAFPPEDRLKLRDALLKHMDLIDAFADENPFQHSEEELRIVRSWKDLVAGDFYVLRFLKKYTVFLTAKEPTAAYGVVALSEPFEEVIDQPLPFFCKTVLLPFQGRIVYDGLLWGYHLIIGSNMTRELNDAYNGAKKRYGVVTSLPWHPAERPQPASKKSIPKKSVRGARTAGGESRIPVATRPAHDRIVELTDAFCREHLDDEYASLCRKLAGVLARKRPSPLIRGKPESWASGIVRVVGWVNFLGDPSQPHHMKMTDIDEGFGVSEATGAAKSMAIRNLLKIRRFEPEWTLPSLMDDNPLIWILEVNGLLTDIRQCPREAQEVAFEKGLIPYIPADWADRSAEE
jgi:hypothetical protein